MLRSAMLLFIAFMEPVYLLTRLALMEPIMFLDHVSLVLQDVLNAVQMEPVLPNVIITVQIVLVTLNNKTASIVLPNTASQLVPDTITPASYLTAHNQVYISTTLLRDAKIVHNHVINVIAHQIAYHALLELSSPPTGMESKK